MIEAVLAEAEQLGFHTLRGAAHEAEGRTPYAPARGGARPARRRRPELIGALTESAQARALAACCPRCGARRGWPRRPSTAIASSRRSRGCSAGAAAERGVVLAIDDLQRADEATVALVHHLARSAAGERLLVVAGMCDEPLPEAAALVRSSLLGARRRHGGGARSARRAARSTRRAARRRPAAAARRSRAIGARPPATRSSPRSWRRRWTPPARSPCRRACARSSARRLERLEPLGEPRSPRSP